MPFSNQICCNAHPYAEIIEDYRAGDQICSECGLIIGDRVIDVGSEWRTFSDQSGSDRNRVGSSENHLLDGSDLSTIIGPQINFTEPGVSQYRQKSSMSSSNRKLIKAFGDIKDMGGRIHVPTAVTDRANALFKDVHVKNSLRGRSNEAIAAACLYIACRQEGVPRTFKELVAVSPNNKKDIGKCFKFICRELETNVEQVMAEDYMSRFGSQLGLPRMVVQAAMHISKRAVELDLVPGKAPMSLAAAAIYLASQASHDRKSREEVGVVAGVAEVTILKCYQLLRPHATKLFPAQFLFSRPTVQLPSA